jgi:hypothetical protein
MKPAFFIRYFIIGSTFAILLILSLNLLTDPYNVTSFNILNIKHKLVRDGRVQKISRIKELKQIDNLILGSSRSEQLNPTTVDHLLGGYTYTFGIGGASVEDALGLLLYLERENKLPKNIILCLDFTMFADGKPSESFYEIPELNFLGQQNTRPNYAAKLFSIDATRASVKTLKAHFKKTGPDSYISNNGFLISHNKTQLGNIENIKKLAHQYYTINYKSGDMELSSERFEYIKRIISLSQKHDMHLYIMLTPVHAYLYKKIDENPKLSNTLQKFKKQLSSMTTYYDTMTINPYTTNDLYFEDAVHYSEELGDLLLHDLIKTTPSKK